MTNNLIITVLGASNPFSKTGRSVSYLISAGDSFYLLDCGAPIFSILPVDILKRIKGIIATHSHEDHKRWFTDFALYRKYLTPDTERLKLITIKPIHEEFKQSSKFALESSLSFDSKKMIDLNYNEFIDPFIIGPELGFKIIKDETGGEYVEKQGVKLSKNEAKIFINPVTGRKRILYKEPNIKEWVEPKIYYSENDSNGYFKEDNIFTDELSGMTIQAVISPSWHGLNSIGVVINYNNVKTFFSSDTVYDIDLWKSFYENKIENDTNLNSDIFNYNYVIEDDINNYVQRMWSKKRFEDAVECYENSDLIVHDIASTKSVVHTDLVNIRKLSNYKVLFTHAPDYFITYKPLAFQNKKYTLYENELVEIVENEILTLDADIFIKNIDRFFVGYKNANGEFVLVKQDDKLKLIPKQELADSAECLFSLEVFEDISGSYYKIDYLNKSDIKVLGNGDVVKIDLLEKDKYRIEKLQSVDRKKILPCR